MKNERFDILIVGAGISGLAAADFITQDNQTRAAAKQPARSFAVIEGAERAGGRTLTVPDTRGFLDVGGEYVAATQSYTMTLLERFNLETFDTYLPAGKTNVLESEDGKLTEFNEPNYPLTEGVESTVNTIETMILPLRAHLESPWESYRAQELDALSVQDALDAGFIGGTSDKLSSELVTIAIRSAFSVEPSAISLLYFLYYGATCGTMRAFENVKGGGDAVRIVKGTNGLVTALVDAIGADKIRYSHDVLKITQDDATVAVEVETPAGARTLEAKQLIVAMSPGATAAIDFVPQLSLMRRGLAAGAPIAATIKGFLTFETAWWRPKFSGYALSAAGPADWVMDNTWWDPADETWKYPALMVFMAGEKARTLSKLTKDQRRDAALAQVYKLFDGASVGNPPCTGYYERDWLKDNWSHGCPAGVLGRNVLTQFGRALRAPEGRIQWAGSEAATDWMGGYMNGAIQAGIRAAGEVLKRLL